jgi:hypothetical protein
MGRTPSRSRQEAAPCGSDFLSPPAKASVVLQAPLGSFRMVRSSIQVLPLLWCVRFAIGPHRSCVELDCCGVAGRAWCGRTCGRRRSFLSSARAAATASGAPLGRIAGHSTAAKAAVRQAVAGSRVLLLGLRRIRSCTADARPIRPRRSSNTDRASLRAHRSPACDRPMDRVAEGSPTSFDDSVIPPSNQESEEGTSVAG